MQVPTATENLPSVQPIDPTPAYQQGASSPDPFGAEIGVGMAKLGQSTSNLGTDVGQIAASWNHEQQTQAARAAATSTMIQVNNLGFKSLDGQGGPGFYAMNGAQAVQNNQAYLDAIVKARDAGRAGLSTMAANMYDLQMDQALASETAAANRFTMQQSRISSVQTGTARMATATNTAVLRYNDPNIIDQQAATIRGEMFERGRIEGWTADTLQAQTQTELSKMYRDAIMSAVTRNDIAGAMAIRDRYGSQLTAVDLVNVQEHMRAPMLRAGAQTLVSQALGLTTRGAGSVPDGKGGTVTAEDAMPPGGVAAPEMSPAQAGFLNTLGMPESGNDYSIRYGGAQGPQHFNDYSKHPNIAVPIPNDPQGRTSTAAGKYQITGSTFNEFAPKAGVTGFSAAEQDRTAWTIASDTYQGKTGRDLKADLEEGGHEAGIVGALASRWPSLPGGSQSRQSLDTFVANLKAATAAASAGPSATSVARDANAYPDFNAATDYILTATQGQPELQNYALSALRAQQSHYNLAVKSERESMGGRFMADTIAALESGRTDIVVPELAIRISHAFDKETADRMVGALNEAQQAGLVYNGIKYATPDDYAKRHQELLSSLGPGNDMPTRAGLTTDTTLPADQQPNSPVAGFAQRAKELAMMEKAWTRRAELMKADPAGYVRDEPSVAAAFAQAHDPASLAAAVQRSMDVQRALDPNVTPHALRASAVAQIVTQLHNLDPKDGSAVATLNGLANQYGSAWPNVFHDLVTMGKLNPSYMVLGTMDTDAQRGAQADLQTALKDQAVRGDKFGSAVNPLDRQTLRQGVDTALANFQASFPVGSSSSAIDATHNAVETLATYYAEHGIPASTAAQNAYDRIITDKYQVDGYLRVPRSFNSQPLSVARVLDAGNTVTAGLTDADLMSQGRYAVTAAQARTRGVWVTNPDGRGVTLMIPTAKEYGGSLIPVQRADKSYIQMDYGALPAGTPTQTQPPTGAL